MVSNVSSKECFFKIALFHLKGVISQSVFLTKIVLSASTDSTLRCKIHRLYVEFNAFVKSQGATTYLK